jgi:hypothetical protein
VVCFGADLPAAALIDERFATCAAALYGPLLEAVIPPPRGRGRR